MELTGYCSCGECCGWHRSFMGRAVYSSGRMKGKPKAVGITAAGTKARYGTAAADTRRYPFGTIFYVKDYGYARVEDRGGAITGDKVDLYFPGHGKALDWGRRKRDVAVWFPPRQ